MTGLTRNVVPVNPREGAMQMAAALEAGVWRALIRWMLGKRELQAQEIGVAYGKAAVPPIWVFVALSAVEIPILHLLIPSTTWRIISLVVGAWGLIWMLGFLASMHTRPHVVGPAGIRLRQGLLVDIPVDWVRVPKVGIVQTRVLRCYADDASAFLDAIRPFVLGTYEPL